MQRSVLWVWFCQKSSVVASKNHLNQNTQKHWAATSKIRQKSGICAMCPTCKWWMGCELWLWWWHYRTRQTQNHFNNESLSGEVKLHSTFLAPFRNRTAGFCLIVASLERLTVDQSIGPLASAFLKIYTQNHTWAVGIRIYLRVTICLWFHRFILSVKANRWLRCIYCMIADVQHPAFILSDLCWEKKYLSKYCTCKAHIAH